MKNEIRFKIPEVGTFCISTNCFKHLPPFPHYSKQQKEEDKKERNKMKEYIVYYNGSGIGEVNKIKDGYGIVKEYAEQNLKLRRAELQFNLEKVEKAIKVTKKFDWIQLFREKQ